MSLKELARKALGLSLDTEAKTEVETNPALEESTEGLLRREGIQVRYIDNAQDAFAAITRLQACRYLGFDIETAKHADYLDHPQAGLDPHLSRIRLLQFYGGGDEVVIFDCFALDDLHLFNPLWQKPLVAHNALFELKFLRHSGIYPSSLGCTLLQANALEGGMPSLAELTRSRLGIEIDKEQQVSDWGASRLSEEQIEYAALDAVLAYRLHKIQIKMLQQEDRLPVYLRMRDALPAIASMELNGIHFDEETHRELMQQWDQEKTLLLDRLRETFGDVNVNSGKQMTTWMEANLSPNVLQGWPKTTSGLYSLSADTLAMKQHLSWVQPLLRFKEMNKLLTTYGEKYSHRINPITKRIHASFLLTGTATGRLSCSKPNIQNPPRGQAFRSLFCAPQGRKIVVADYSQIELRVAALVSGDIEMLKAYENGIDLHRKTASAISGVLLDQVTKEQRQAAKAVNFGLLFGQGARGLARYAKSSYRVEMSEEQAENARRAFFQTYPQMRKWQRYTGNQAERTQFVVTPGGRVRDFSREKNGYRYTEALNTPIQGGAAEILLQALIRLQTRIDESKIDAKLVNVVHDEIVLETSDAHVEQAKTILEEAMIAGMLDLFPNASTKGLVEAHIGNNWDEAK